MKNNDKSNYSRVLVIGAGDAGKMLVNEIRHKEHQLKRLVVGIVDDDIEKLKSNINGVYVIGTTSEIPNIVMKYNVDEIIFSIANIDSSRKKEIIDICRMTGKSVKTIPSIFELIDCKVDFRRIRDIQIEDLLGRDSVSLDVDAMKAYIENRTVLITGGGGSIGSEICRQVAGFTPKKLVIVDNNENNAYDIQQELKMNYSSDELDMEVAIGNIREKKRLEYLFEKYRPDIVFHAAAHKHVPIMENNKVEAVKNNVIGTLNVIETADEYNVEKFVLISTDKAVNPTNIMGATKRAAEIMIQSFNERSRTDYVAVRFGNVLGSNGSVIPLFRKQIEAGGPVTLTHPDIIRYFMTIKEAASLVIEAGAMAKGGEIFILDMGQPVKVCDLAKKMIRLSGYEPDVDIEIKIIGLREGEKLYEELLMDEEGLRKTKHKKIFIGNPVTFDFETVKAYVERLRKAAYSEDDELTDNIMREFVTTYIHPEDVNNEQ